MSQREVGAWGGLFDEPCGDRPDIEQPQGLGDTFQLKRRRHDQRS